MADPVSWFTIGSGLIGMFGQYQAQQYQSQRAEQDAKIGKIRADQIDAAYRTDLSSTISNIKAISATTGAGTDSPTGQAIRDENVKISERNRTRDVANQNMQAFQSEQDARFYKASAGIGLLGGVGKTLVKLYG